MCDDLNLTAVDPSTAGVKRGVTGDLIVDREGADDSDEPRTEITQLSPGDTIRFQGEQARISSISERVRQGRRNMYAIGFGADVVGTVATLHVDRDPYLLDICNGPICSVHPADVVAEVD